MLENEVPTRADIAGLLKKVKKEKGAKASKKLRNDLRRAEVESILPVEVFGIVESDLASYAEWEKEVEDEV